MRIFFTKYVCVPMCLEERKDIQDGKWKSSHLRTLYSIIFLSSEERKFDKNTQLPLVLKLKDVTTNIVISFYCSRTIIHVNIK